VTELSLPRLYALRVGYLVLGGGLALVKWPLFFQAACWRGLLPPCCWSCSSSGPGVQGP